MFPILKLYRKVQNFSFTLYYIVREKILVLESRVISKVTFQVKLCGKRIPSGFKLKSLRNEMVIKFQTNSASEKAGFRATLVGEPITMFALMPLILISIHDFK